MYPLIHIPAFEDNYIWVLVSDDGRATAVDPGDADPLIALLEQRGWPLDSVLITHHHADHCGGLPDLRKRWPRMRAIGPVDPRIPELDCRVADGDTVTLTTLRREFTVMSIPGHTSSHISFHDAELLFCGDTLFSLGCGRMFEGTPAQMLASLDRLAALPGVLQVCCGHEYTEANGRFAQIIEPGNAALAARVTAVSEYRAMNKSSLPSTIASELACNPFLRCDQPTVQQGVASQLGFKPKDRIECFAALRRMKDAFRG